MNEPTHFKKGKTICLDFDGVVHMYDTPWTATEEINDGVVPGALEFIKETVAVGYRIAIHSCRSEIIEGRRAMRLWLYRKFREEGFASDIVEWIMQRVFFPEHKPHADVYIDDRGIGFDGTFPDLDYIRSFKPWNKQ